MASPGPGYLAYGLNPNDRMQKPNRPAIILYVGEGENPDLLVIFGQSFPSGEGRYVHIEKSLQRRITVQGYFYEGNIFTLPESHFNSIIPHTLPKDLWQSLQELLG